MRCHPARWPQLGAGRESRGGEHTVTVRPAPFNPTAFCYTDPNHCTPALHLPHFQTWVVRQTARFREDVKKGNDFPQHLRPNFRLEVKADPRPLCTKRVLMHGRFGEVTV